MSRDASSHASVPHTIRRLRIGAIVSSYHRDITGGMAASARETLGAAGVADEDILEIVVPGAFELPIVAQELAARGDIDAVLTFGLILKGETEHDRHIATAVARALMEIGLVHKKPVLFGVLTCSTLAQAEARAKRADAGGQDKGREVARAALEALEALNNVRKIPVVEESR